MSDHRQYCRSIALITAFLTEQFSALNGCETTVMGCHFLSHHETVCFFVNQHSLRIMNQSFQLASGGEMTRGQLRVVEIFHPHRFPRHITQRSG
jgi:hypothetical protein